jgi:hypothetical protein
MSRASLARRLRKLERSRRQQQAAPVLHIVAYDADTGRTYPPAPTSPRATGFALGAGAFDYMAAVAPILAPEEPE